MRARSVMAHPLDVRRGRWLSWRLTNEFEQSRWYYVNKKYSQNTKRVFYYYLNGWNALNPFSQLLSSVPYLYGRVPLARPGGFVHAIVENACGWGCVFLLWHLHLGVFGLFQLCSFFGGAFFAPANLIMKNNDLQLLNTCFYTVCFIFASNW